MGGVEPEGGEEEGYEEGEEKRGHSRLLGDRLEVNEGDSQEIGVKRGDDNPG